MAASKIRRIVKRFFIILNIFIAVLFLIGCLVPFLNPSVWWFMGFMGLIFPYLVFLLVFSIIFWWIIRPGLSLIPILTLLIGWKQLSVLFGVHLSENFVAQQDSTHLRIVDWNIRSLEGLSNRSEIKKLDRATIPETIIQKNPAIICLQEFNNSNLQNNVSAFTKDYPFYYFSHDFSRNNANYQAGSIIFSKYPIIDSGKVQFPGPNSESLIYADIKTPQNIIRVFTTHLQSFRFKKSDYDDIKTIKNTEEKVLPASKNIVQKMKIAFTRRGEQARLVKQSLDKSPYPSIVCGDFNDVPNSFTYFHIRGNRQDVFLEKGLGFGRTYLSLAPTLRIDYILPDNHFKIHQFDMIDEDLSDHMMLVADLSLKR
jgi:endonuclease/exonuclease/phosphatase family metal-dependent hydrolase